MVKMSSNEPRDHHVVPQFFLKNFAVDEARTKIATVAKDRNMAVWMERSIKELGYERDFYVHIERGRPISVETTISRTIETPISQSDTWAKIASGQTDALDRSDRAILYALVRHLEARTPHYRATSHELADMAANPDTDIPFTDKERRMYAVLRANPEVAKFMFNSIATKRFDRRDFDRALILVVRSPIRLRTSTTPVIVIPAPNHTVMDLPLPGMTPFQRILTINYHTMVSVVVGDFDGHFSNIAMTEETALGFNRNVVGHFAYFPSVRHLVTDRNRLAEDMTWAPYELILDSPRKTVFRRTDLF